MKTLETMEIYPVVHVKSLEQAREQADLALVLGADGIYLIAHGRVGPNELTDVFNMVAEDHEDAFIGINYLDLGVTALDYLADQKIRGNLKRLPDAVWADDAKGRWNKATQSNERPPETRDIQLLGGIAFKYTHEYTDDPLLAAAEVERNASLVDVVTTSGPGTGQAPPLEKIKAMKVAAGEKHLAVASGIDISNIDIYRGYVDKILVASSVETRPYSGEFDPNKLNELIKAAHSNLK